jgi:hypothetical protein
MVGSRQRIDDGFHRRRRWIRIRIVESGYCRSVFLGYRVGTTVGIISPDVEINRVRHRINDRIGTIERKGTATRETENWACNFHLHHRSRAGLGLRQRSQQPNLSILGAAADLRRCRGARAATAAERDRGV